MDPRLLEYTESEIDVGGGGGGGGGYRAADDAASDVSGGSFAYGGGGRYANNDDDNDEDDSVDPLPVASAATGGVQILPDGTRRKTNADGSVFEVRPDGTTRFVDAPGARSPQAKSAAALVGAVKLPFGGGGGGVSNLKASLASTKTPNNENANNNATHTFSSAVAGVASAAAAAVDVSAIPVVREDSVVEPTPTARAAVATAITATTTTASATPLIREKSTTNDEDDDDDADNVDARDVFAAAAAVATSGEHPHHLLLDEETRRAAADQAEHFQLRAMELERMLKYIQKRQAKQLKYKDDEINDLKAKLQRSKEAEDASKVEMHKTVAKLEASHKAALAALKAENDRLKLSAAGGSKASTTASATVASSLLPLPSSIFSSSSSSKVQAKIQANQADRELGRQLERTEEMLAKERARAERHKSKAAEYLELATAQQFKVHELEKEVLGLRKTVTDLTQRCRKYKDAKTNLELEREDLVLKAGWAAEQLQATQSELEFERSKRVPQSRQQEIKRMEDFRAMQKEVEGLRRALEAAGKPAPAAAAAPTPQPKSASTTTTTPAKAEAATEQTSKPVEDYVPAPSTTSEGALGSQTISELVALKARQRQERALKLDKLIEKNRQARQSLEGNPNDLGRMMRKALGNRRGLMGENEAHSDSDDGGGAASDADDWS